jgi:hypothetical protein
VAVILLRDNAAVFAKLGSGISQKYFEKNFNLKFARWGDPVSQVVFCAFGGSDRSMKNVNEYPQNVC